MHNRGLNLLIFVLVMGPLIWLSQRMGWGDTGTFVCVVIGLVGGWLLLRSSKSVSKKVGRTFNRGKKGAAADFLFSPSEPMLHQQDLLQYRKLANSRVGAWNAPQTPMMPHPQKMPTYDATRASRNRVQITQIPDPTAGTLQAPRHSPHAAMQQDATRRAKAGGPPLQLGPGAQMYLTSSLTGAIVVDAQPRRMAAPVFIEEWMRLGLGLLVVDVYGEYINYLAPLLSEGFGFLAASHDWQGNLTKLQQSRYMRLEGTDDALIVGQGIASEGLQVVFNVPSYQNTVNMGTYLLALLGGIERKAREIPAKPCAILITDARPLLPENDEDCLIANAGVAQNVFDMLMNLLENAGLPGLKNLAVFLATPTLEEIEDEVLTACRLWVVNSTNDQIISDVSEYIDLSQEEVEQLQDGDVLLLNAPQAESSFVRFRKTQLSIKNRPLLPSQERKTEELNTEQEGDTDTQGESQGLKEQA